MGQGEGPGALIPGGRGRPTRLLLSILQEEAGLNSGLRRLAWRGDGAPVRVFLVRASGVLGKATDNPAFVFPATLCRTLWVLLGGRDRCGIGDVASATAGGKNCILTTLERPRRSSKRGFRVYLPGGPHVLCLAGLLSGQEGCAQPSLLIKVCVLLGAF